MFNFCICHALYLRYLAVVITYSDFSLPYGLNILYSPRTPFPGHLNVIKVPVLPPHRPDRHWSSPGSHSTGKGALSTGVKRPERELNHFHLVPRCGCTFTHRTSSWPGIWARRRLSVVTRVGSTRVIVLRILFLLYLFNGFYGFFFVYSDYSLTVSERHVRTVYSSCWLAWEDKRAVGCWWHSARSSRQPTYSTNCNPCRRLFGGEWLNLVTWPSSLARGGTGTCLLYHY